jgi:hypothetical protein
MDKAAWRTKHTPGRILLAVPGLTGAQLHPARFTFQVAAAPSDRRSVLISIAGLPLGPLQPGARISAVMNDHAVGDWRNRDG